MTRDANETYAGSSPTSEILDASTLRRQNANLNGRYNESDITTQMEQIAQSVNDFRSEFKTLPVLDDPAYFDADGKPFLSWRVHVLPYLDQSLLYERFNLDEPWDSANNLPLMQYMPDVYRDIDDPFDSTSTRFQRLVDNGSMFSSTGPAPDIRDFISGLSDSIGFIRTGADVAVPWTKPADVTYVPGDPLANVGNVGGHIFVALVGGWLEFLTVENTELIDAFVQSNRTTSADEYYNKTQPKRITISEGGQIGSIDFWQANVSNVSYYRDDTEATVTVGDPALLSVTPNSLAFSNDDWEVIRSITFQAVDNDVVDGNRTTTITIADQVIEIVILDDDSHQFYVDSDVAIVDESGATVTRSVVLNSAPTSDVVVHLSSRDTGEVSVSPNTLTFSPSNWNTPQSFVITGIADTPLADGDRLSLIDIQIDPAQSDPNFAVAQDVAVLVTNEDRDAAEIIVDQTTVNIQEGQAGQTLSVTLSSQPIGPVLVNVASDDSQQVVATSSQLEFTPDNWNIPKEFTVQAIDDMVLDGDIEVLIRLTVDSLSAEAFLGANEQTVSVTVRDDELAGFTITPTGDTVVSESGSTDTLNVVLDAVPLTPVTINVSASDPSEVIAFTSTLVFDAMIWDQPQTVTIAGVDDGLVDLDQLSQIHVEVDPNSDSGFAKAPSQSIDVVTTDNDVADILIDISSVIVSENGDSVSAHVTLSHEPLSDVVTTVVVADEGEIATDFDRLLFTTQNWNVPQTLLISGIDDMVVDGDQQTSITIAVAGDESDVGFNAVMRTLLVTNEDDEVARYAIVQSGNDTTVSESGTSDTLSVSLNAAPNSDVVLVATTSDVDEAVVSMSPITFTPSNWDVPQTITVTGVDDDFADGEQLSIVRFSIDDLLSDSEFHALSDTVIGVHTTDDETAGFDVSTANPLIVSESGTEATFTVALTAAPLSQVTLAVVSNDATEVSVDTILLPFNSTNWNSPQSVVIRGVDDGAVDGDIESTLTIKIVADASDAAFLSVGEQEISIVTTDNDVASILVTPPALLEVSEQDNSVASFDVQLSAAPLSDVMINVTVDDPTELTTASHTLRFTTENWNTPKPVVLRGVDDDLVDGDVTSQVSFAVTSLSDPAFTAALPKSFTITTQDDDVADFFLTIANDFGMFDEKFGETSIDVHLSAAPLTDVTLQIVSEDITEVTVGQSTLVFTPDNWREPQAVDLHIVDDEVIDGDQTTRIVFKVLDDQSDSGFDSVGEQSLSVTTLDDDNAVLLLNSPVGGIFIDETGRSQAIGTRLLAAPLTNVVVRYTSSNETEALTDESELTFTPENWNVVQEVRVIGIDDDIVDGDQVGFVTVSIDDEASDAAFRNLPDRTVSFTTHDDDTPGFSLALTDDAVVVDESGTTDTVEIRLDKAPLTDVTVQITADDETEVSLSTEQVSFTPENWNVSQRVTIAGVDDPQVDGNQTTTLTFSIDAGSDASFASVATQTAQVITTDDEVAGFTVTEADGGTFAREGRAGGSVWVVLSAEPLSRVRLLARGGTQALAGGGLLDFYPATWNVPQEVDVIAWTDNTVDGTQSQEIEFTVDAEDSDPKFHQVAPQSITATIFDSDVAELVIDARYDDLFNGNFINTLIAHEGRAAGDFEVTLRDAPLTDTVFEITADRDDEVTFGPTTIVFTNENWNVPQTIIFEAVDDTLVDLSSTTELTIAAVPALSDPAFANVSKTVPILKIDDEEPSIIATETEETTVVFESGQTDTIAVTLPGAPIDPVFVNVGVMTDQVTTDRSQLTFTAENWDQPQLVTLTAIDNAILEGDRNLSVFFIGDETSDEHYAQVLTRVNVAVIDDEEATFTIAGDTSAITEGSESLVQTIVLNSQPLSPVIIDVGVADETQIEADVSAFTFTPENWNQPQTVSITAIDDLLVESDANVSVTYGATSDSDEAFLDSSVDRTLLIQDNDAPSFSFSLADTSVTEGSSGTSAQLVLDRQPQSDVHFEISITNPQQWIEIDSPLVFTAENWNVPQTIEIVPVDDLVSENTLISAITANVSPQSDAHFRDLSSSSHELELNDDDQAGVAIDGSSLEFDEAGGEATFTISLTSQPATPVTIEFLPNEVAEFTVSPNQVTFDGQIWDVPQTITLTGIADFDVDPDFIASVDVHITEQSDAQFMPLIVDPLSVTILDQPIQNITLVRRGDEIVALDADHGAEIEFQSNADERFDVNTGPRSVNILVDVAEWDEQSLQIETGPGDDRIELTNATSTTIRAGDGFDELVILDTAINLDDLPDGAWANVEAVMLHGGDDQPIDIAPADIRRLLNGTTDVSIDLGSGSIQWGTQWTVTAPIHTDGGYVHQLTSEGVTLESATQQPWMNPVVTLDVNRDGNVRPLDALLQLNLLSRRGSSDLLPLDGSEPIEYFYDVTGDNRITPIDALMVINFLGRRSEAESESVVSIVTAENHAFTVTDRPVQNGTLRELEQASTELHSDATPRLTGQDPNANAVASQAVSADSFDSAKDDTALEQTLDQFFANWLNDESPGE